MAKQDGEGSNLHKELSNIFTEVQEKLPSLEFDLSDASSDEELSIFNWSMKSPSGGSGRDDLLSPTSWQSALVIDDTQQDKEQVVQAKMKDCGSSPITTDYFDYDELGCNTNETIDLSDVNLNLSTKDDVLELDAINFEGNNNKQLNNNEIRKQDIIMKSLPSRIVSKFITNQAPVPDFKRVKERNLDQLLEDLSVGSRIDSHEFDTPHYLIADEDETCKYSIIKVYCSIRSTPHPHKLLVALGAHPTPTNCAVQANNTSLMDKLAQLCMSQADEVKNISSSSKYKVTKYADAGQNVKVNKVGTGISTTQIKSTSTSVGVSMGVSTDVSTETQPVTTCSKGVSACSSSNNSNSKTANRQTIYLDLRVKDKPKSMEKVDEPSAGFQAIQRILGVDPDANVADDSDDNDDDVIDWQKQRKQIREALSEGQSIKTCNDMPSPRKVIRTNKVTPPPRVMHLPQKIIPENKVKCESLSPRVNSDIPTIKDASNGQETGQSIKKRQEADLKKLRRQREEEKATKLRLKSQLEALKPTHSIGGKNKSCFSTDTVFDLEASYTKFPDCLPPVASYSGETLLLSVCLTNSLRLKANSSAGGKVIDTSNHSGISATYITLLSWLLSCIPNNFDFLMETEVASESALPFYVVGLQQILMDGELMLMTAIRPAGKVHSTTTKHKRKKKDLKRNCSQFESSVVEFLNKNTLCSVCPEAEKAFSLIINSSGEPAVLMSNPSQKRLFSDGTYIPELPFISSKPLNTFISVQSNTDIIDRVFNAPVGFFWQTLESENLTSDTESSVSYDNVNDVQNTMSLIYKSIYQDQICMLSILNRIIYEGIDVCGVRLIYTPEDMSLEVPAASVGRKQAADSPRTGSDQMIIDDLNNVGPILAFALRGAKARIKCLNIVGPSDPQIARRTDPKSLIALFGGDSRSEVAIYCPRNEGRVNYELALWFGGRVPPNGVVDVGSITSRSQKTRGLCNKRKQAKSASNDESECNEDQTTLSSIPPALLTASSASDIFLVVSPIIPPMCIGTILSTCSERGFQLRGLRRLRLNFKRTSVLGMTGIQAKVFSPLSCTTPTSPQTHELREQLEQGFATAPPFPMPSLLILLRKENAYGQGNALIEGLMVQLALQGLLLSIQNNINTKLISSSCFHIVPYSESHMANLGGDICRVSDTDRHISLLNQGRFYTNPELEQIVVVTLVGVEAMKLTGAYVDKILGFSTTGIELLGMKWLPSLTSAQAKEMTPFEVGDRHWHSSLQTLTSNPVVINVMRGVDAFQRLRSILRINLNMPISRSQPPCLEKLISPTAELAYRQTVVFFSDRELFSDPTVRINLQYQPPLRNPNLQSVSTARFMWADDPVSSPGKSRGRVGKSGKKSFVVEESVFKSMTAGPRPITTLAVIKPYSIERNLVKILKYMTREGFKVVGLRLVQMSRDQALALIPNSFKTIDRYIEFHTELLTTNPSMVLCLQRENAVKKLLDLCGPEDPKHCKSINQFLWRGIFGKDVIRNGLHVSNSYSAAVQEEKLFFPTGLCCESTPDLVADGIHCPSQDKICGAKGQKFMKKNTKKENREDYVFLAAHSGLCETTCVVLTPPLILQTNQNNQNMYVDILDKLVSAGFEVVGARMICLTEKQAGKVLNIYKSSMDKLVSVHTKPSLVLALERDNAVSCWDTILKSSVVSSEILLKYAEDILRPLTQSQAHTALGFFFDELCNSSHGEIIHEKY
ncbi:dynein axonemal assembly factor 8-like [Antedon mediterranea]|uniref:dynein axonemal assembly factor 8-like n=1 Tax=Antedon mediterranea TaxID=105859 RepID=UPI003AF78F74